MTHESLLARVEGAEPTITDPIASADPTPMVTETPQQQNHAVSNHNDRRWLNQSDVPEKILEYIEERASPLKSWFKPGRIAEAIDETPQAVGPAIAAMYRSDRYPEIAERRRADKCYVYRVEVDV